jgi:Na+/H+ antiporter NhaA
MPLPDQRLFHHPRVRLCQCWRVADRHRHRSTVCTLAAGDCRRPFLGKQLGIFGAVWIAVRLGVAGQLRGATWLQVYGVSLLCGIGFTMSLFIGALAFPGSHS